MQAEQSGHFDGLKEDNTYGRLDRRNIGRVVFGSYRFNTHYGNAAYFDPRQQIRSLLGYEYANKVSQVRDCKARKKIIQEGKFKLSFSSREDDLWLDEIYVCQHCFKYSSNRRLLQEHKLHCKLNDKYPNIGRLVYRDDERSCFIIHVRGYQELLFCQNLCLFSKLFLDDKSVFYNIDCFDFFVVYGLDDQKRSYFSGKYLPMGYFSKELLSWDNNNNLACICVFPPFQGRQLGWLMVEFLYALAKVTPGQFESGPEFPLSTSGKSIYFKFWSRKLVPLLYMYIKKQQEFTLADLACETGFRKEDILLTLQYMKVLIHNKQNPDKVDLLIKTFEKWCDLNNYHYLKSLPCLNQDCLLL